MPTTKTCTKCGETKPLDGFYKDGRREDGRTTRCKPCMAEYHRRYREENRDKLAEYYRSYREENRDKIAEKGRRYREENLEKVAERKRRYWAENRDEMLERQRRYKAENRNILNAKNSKHHRSAQELTEAFATVPPWKQWTQEEEHFLTVGNGMTVYQKATTLGRTYTSCRSKLYELRKKLGVSPGDH